jgi:N-methylhydantoinase B
MINDPVLLSLVQKQIDHVARQMGWVMTRTARSPIFSQSHDFSCFIGDARGTVISQADGLPIHTGGGGFALRALLAAFGNTMEDGDVYLLNDPYTAGNNHLPDWTVVRPVFVDGLLSALVCNRAHQSDIGGGAAGTYNAAATEIFHEGIRLPPLRLIEKGKVRDDLWQLLLLNTRCPDLLDGDLRAMLGSTEIGAARLSALIRELGTTEGQAHFDAILGHAERVMRAEIGRMPAGTYRGEDASDTDCFETTDVRVRLKLDVADGGMVFDFTGSDPQTRGFKNSSLANTHSAVYVAVGAFFDVGLPRNEGTYRPIRIVAPEGTVVNARYPAAMTMNTVYPAGEIIHACWKALAQADPERACAGWGKVAYCITSGADSRGLTYVMYHWHGSSGGGAVAGRDGFNTIGQLTTLGGMSLPNVEVFEQLYPITVNRQEFRRDAAGPGRFRGGTGVDYEVEVAASAEYSFRGEGLYTPSGFGVVGGGTGQSGAMTLTPKGQTPIDVPQYGVRALPPLHIKVSSPGGGGWGNPHDRDPALVLRDIEDGVVSVEAARQHYAVILMPDGSTVDLTATQALRRSLSHPQPPGP